MPEFDYTFISILFGLAGTFILLFSSIFSYKKDIKNKEKYSLISNIIGFLFLFDSFFYLFWPEISSQMGSTLSITEFSYWPYYLFIAAGIFISLYLVKEKDFGSKLIVSIFPESYFEFFILYSPVILSILVGILNADFLLFFSTFIWLFLMVMVGGRN